jgi:hypothetical protein
MDIWEMSRMLLRVWLAALCFGAMISAAVADDWVATRLRGQVLQLVDQEWLPLKRGDVVPDDRVIRTLANGRVEFQRDAEVISLAPQTQVQIVDKSGRRFTTVKQHFGVVEIEAEVQNVQHFAVETPFLAAVVKGTRFTVRSGKNWSKVDVRRGHVAVESEVTHSTTLIAKGQSATASTTAELEVAGKGDLPPVVDANGKLISLDGVPIGKADDATELAAKLAKAAAKATGEEKKALEKVAKEAAKAAEKAAKDEEKAQKDAAKAGDKAEKPADKTGKTDGKAAEKAAKDEEKAQKGADKAAGKAEKAAPKAEKSENKSDNSSGKGSGEGEGTGKSGKGKGGKG